MSLPAAQTPNGARACPRCETSFTCGMAAGADSCWCFDLPHIVPITHANTEGCLCPDCLRALIDSLESEAENSTE